jgi:chromosomal replication initiator protein
VSSSIWKECVEDLKDRLTIKQFNTWILPLQFETRDDEWMLFAPNNFVFEYVRDNFLDMIKSILQNLHVKPLPIVKLIVGSKTQDGDIDSAKNSSNSKEEAKSKASSLTAKLIEKYRNCLNATFTFDSFVTGQSNQLAAAAALQVASEPGKAYNPLFIYGGVGLGKTHLLHAVGNEILRKNPQANILYLHAERFVADMVRALQRKSIDDFKNFYRSLDALLIDDIQFFAGKERSQEEFFHTFNALFESQQQIILTCDRYPKEVDGLEDRLKSRFGWGLTVAIEPPEFETRVAILATKAQQSQVELPEEVAFFIAKHVQSNVRELEGALKRVIATSHFVGKPITLEFAKNALKDLLAVHARLITIENIQKIVAEYFKVKVSELLSKKRTRTIARPRQIAMALAKELTDRSLPEIASVFGGRDHTTVLHACRTIKELVKSDANIAEDYKNLLRILIA